MRQQSREKTNAQDQRNSTAGLLQRNHLRERERERDTYLSAGSTWILPSTAATTTRGAYLYDEVRSVGPASYTNLSAFENSKSSTEAANFSSSHTIAITQLDLNPPTNEPLDILSSPHTQQKTQSTHTQETSFLPAASATRSTLTVSLSPGHTVTTPTRFPRSFLLSLPTSCKRTAAAATTKTCCN